MALRKPEEVKVNATMASIILEEFYRRVTKAEGFTGEKVKLAAPGASARRAAHPSCPERLSLPGSRRGSRFHAHQDESPVAIATDKVDEMAWVKGYPGHDHLRLN